MALCDEFIELERAAWQALSTSRERAAEFYDAILANDVLMLLPGGLVIDDREQLIDPMRGAPWTSFELSHERVLALTNTSAASPITERRRRRGRVSRWARF
jgi:hypothetical protein